MIIINFIQINNDKDFFTSFKHEYIYARIIYINQ